MASDRCPNNVGKQAWPELLGARVAVAVATIPRQNPNVRIDVRDEATANNPSLPAIFCDRITVWVRGGIVSRVPVIGF
ncbi:hypothetical protein Syun_010474 [Stephania yunnanensis]|uniref:Uncharacterized protein n=1 Tax=Stephania yunnanensis TaxID=152371 RepID=A0AAP0KHI1_9MAGN